MACVASLSADASFQRPEVCCFSASGEFTFEIIRFQFINSYYRSEFVAFDFGARVKAREKGISNTVGHRSEEMTCWMRAAAARIEPSAGDQFRLAFA
jgi:hypothetical protein